MSAAFQLGQLRHLYAQMLDGRVQDTREAARGLLGPAIEQLELAEVERDRFRGLLAEIEEDAMLSSSVRDRARAALGRDAAGLPNTRTERDRLRAQVEELEEASLCGSCAVGHVVEARDATIAEQARRIEELERSEREFQKLESHWLRRSVRATSLEQALREAQLFIDHQPTRRWDALADRFYRDTGIMAPGKSAAPAAAMSQPPDDVRIDQYRRWIESSLERVRTLIDAALEQAAPGEVKPMKAGDSVHDSVTGEDWVLSFYDDTCDEASWCGWPEGLVVQASTRLSVVESCSDDESAAMLRTWADKNSDDLRTRAARRLLQAATGEGEE